MSATDNIDELETPRMPSERPTLPEIKLTTEQRLGMIDQTLAGISAETKGLAAALSEIKGYLAGQVELGETLREAAAEFMTVHEEQRRIATTLDRIETARHLAELNGEAS